MEIGFTNEVYRQLRDVGPTGVKAVYSALQATAEGRSAQTEDIHIIDAKDAARNFKYLYSRQNSLGIVVDVGKKVCMALGVGRDSNPSIDYWARARDRYEVLSCTNYFKNNVDYISTKLPAEKFVEVFLPEKMPHLFTSDWLFDGSHFEMSLMEKAQTWPQKERSLHYKRVEPDRSAGIIKWIERHAAHPWMSTDARKNFAKLLNTADFEPQFIERNGNWLVVMSYEQLKNAVKPLTAAEIRKNASAALSGATPLIYRSVEEETSASFNPLG